MKDWKYIAYREDIDDHCQYCNRETNKLHWYKMNEQQVASICNFCKSEIERQIKQAKEED